jgi:hypothetical protein
MVHTIFLSFCALVLLVTLAGFLRGLWVVKPRRVPGPSESDWSQSIGSDYSGHGGDGGLGGH